MEEASNDDIAPNDTLARKKEREKKHPIILLQRQME